MAELEDAEGDDLWDEDRARGLVGCTLLVGLNYVDHDDKLIRRRQMFGTVVSVDRRSGIAIRQRGDGELFTIAPALDAVYPAMRGIYRLADEDEIVEDPDFTTLLTVRSPSHS